MKKAILIAALMTAPATAPAMAQTCFDVDGFCEVDTSKTVDRSVTNKNRNDKACTLPSSAKLTRGVRAWWERLQR